jgi:hypothetical protein
MRHLSFALGFVLLFNSFAHAQPCGPDAVGNSIDHARDLSELKSTTYLNDCLDPISDRDDFFRFRFTVSGVVNILVFMPNSVLTVELLDVNGLRIVAASGGPRVGIGQILPPGTYHIRLTGASAQGRYSLELDPSIQIIERQLKAGQSLAWTSIVTVLDGLSHVNFQVVEPANAGSRWIVDGVLRPVDSSAWTLPGTQYNQMRYAAGSAGSVETVFFQLVNTSGPMKWQGVRITSVTP